MTDSSILDYLDVKPDSLLGSYTRCYCVLSDLCIMVFSKKSDFDKKRVLNAVVGIYLDKNTVIHSEESGNYCFFSVKNGLKTLKLRAQSGT